MSESRGAGTGSPLPDCWWHDEGHLRAQLARHGSAAAVARAHGGSPGQMTVIRWADRFGITLRRTGGNVPSYLGTSTEDAPPGVPDPKLEELRGLISGRGGRGPRTVSELADTLDCAPRMVRAMLDELREGGYRIPDVDDGSAVTIQRIPPARENLHRSLLEGDAFTIGVVSDTHLCSREHAGEQLDLAYDVFADEGVTEVLHAGDGVTGRGIYRTQDQDLTAYTFEDQVAEFVRDYPRREGITTRIIGGNHDLEGEFGKIGADPMQAAANRRPDIEYLGPYDAYVDYGPDPEHPCWINVKHGAGGMSYAYSYKAQKMAEGYEQDRKPAVMIVGHWHCAAWLEAADVQVLFPGCFQWKSDLAKRLNLKGAVGFYLLDLVVGPDGELVQFQPRWHRFRERRIVAFPTGLSTEA